MSLSYSKVATGVHVVNLSGPLTASLAQEVAETFETISNQGIGRIVVNLADVPLIDSRGLVAMVAGFRAFGSRAQNFQLAALQDQPKLLLELTGFDQIFQTCENVTEAMVTDMAGQSEIENDTANHKELHRFPEEDAVSLFAVDNGQLLN